MSFLKTVLGALALCAALLAAAAFMSGPGDSATRLQPLGLTAAAVLASDGMAPDGRTGPSAHRAVTPDRIVLGKIEDRRPAG